MDRLTGDRDGQPCETILRIDPVAIAPIVLRILHFIVVNEEIGVTNEVEIPLPWDVIRLNHYNSLQGSPFLGTRIPSGHRRTYKNEKG